MKNKLVVLDFFTYCCVNCLHILPDLEDLETKFKVTDGVIVVGVHSAKFSNEKIISNILSAVIRYHIDHPVVNDSEALLWNQLQIACWPTLVVVSPTGKYLKTFVGEGHKKSIFNFLEIAKRYYASELSLHNISLSLEKDKMSTSPLLFPGKVAVNKDGNTLAVSDTGHNRVILLGLDGIVKVRNFDSTCFA